VRPPHRATRRGAQRAAACALLAGAAACRAPADPTLTLIGSAPITVAPEIAGQGGGVVSGLSGLAYDPATGTWLAVSDADPAHARRLRIDATGGRLVAEAVALVPIARTNHRDAEAIARAADGAWVIAYESPPGAVVFDPSLGSPRALRAAGAAAEGLARNRAWESVAALPTDPPTTLLISEFGPPATPADPGRVRRARAVLIDPARDAEAARGDYPITPPPAGLGGAGVTDLCALDETRFLALERRVTLAGYDAAVFLVTMTHAGAALTFTKTPLGSLRALGVADPGNAEAIAIGPAAEDGSRLVVILNDDNRGRDGQYGARAIALRLAE